MSEWQDGKLYEVDGNYLNAMQDRVTELVDNLEGLTRLAQQVADNLTTEEVSESDLRTFQERIGQARNTLDKHM